MKLGPKNFLKFFGHIYEKKNYFFPLVFKLLYGGASRKKFENRFFQIARFLGIAQVPLKF
jgi:hypothetical protein